MNVLRLLSLADGLLLLVLVYAALTQDALVVAAVGPTHGLLFLLLLASLGWAARHRWWGWWFVAAVAVLGPFASVPGLEHIHRRQEA